jgi:hypothetical protein
MLGGKGVAGQTISIKAPGTVGLRIRAKGGKRTQLFERGRVGLKLPVTFAPDGDPAEGPRTVKRRVKLIAS